MAKQVQVTRAMKKKYSIIAVQPVNSSPGVKWIGKCPTCSVSIISGIPDATQQELIESIQAHESYKHPTG